jgi:hypothetical protein
MDADQVIMLTTKVWSTTAAMAAGGTMVHRKKKMTPMAIAAEPPGKLQHFIVCKLVISGLLCDVLLYMQYTTYACLFIVPW